MPEIIDPVFAKTSQNDRFLLSENERFGLIFVKTGSINSGTDLIQNKLIPTSLGRDWIENKRFELVFAKTIIFMPKTRSINSGTDHLQLKKFQVGGQLDGRTRTTFTSYIFVFHLAQRRNYG